MGNNLYQQVFRPRQIFLPGTTRFTQVGLHTAHSHKSTDDLTICEPAVIFKPLCGTHALFLRQYFRQDGLWILTCQYPLHPLPGGAAVPGIEQELVIQLGCIDFALELIKAGEGKTQRIDGDQSGGGINLLRCIGFVEGVESSIDLLV